MSSTAARAPLFILGFGLLTGCPDPTAGGNGTQGPSGPGAAGGPAGGPGAAGGPAGGPPDGAMAGGEGGAPPMNAGNAGGRPDQARFTVAEGEGVEISGTFTYEGSAKGDLRIDFLTMDGGGPPTLVNTLTLEKTGEWRVDAPKNFGEVYIVAFVDQKSDGPSADDPAARIADAVDIGSSPVTGLNLVLTENADLGDLAPGAGAPPEGSGAPDVAVPPAEGGEPGTQDGVTPEGEAVDNVAPDLGTPPAEGSLQPGEGDAPLPEGTGAPKEGSLPEGGGDAAGSGALPAEGDAPAAGGLPEGSAPPAEGSLPASGDQAAEGALPSGGE